jgi:dihydroorotase
LALEEAIERGLLTEKDVTQERLENFLGGFGRRFYKLDDSAKSAKIVLERKGARIPNSVKSTNDSIEVALLRGGDSVFSLRWVSTWYIYNEFSIEQSLTNHR